MRRLGKLLELKSNERRLLVTAFALLAVIRLGLWLLPFQTLRRLLGAIAHPAHKLPSQVRVNKVVWAVTVASRYMPGGVKCLARALATQVLLERRGIDSQLRIGVASVGGSLEAHAWVESQGKIVIGGLKDLARYTPLPALEVKNL